MRRVVPAVFTLQGELRVVPLRASREAVVAALGARPDAVLAVDTGMRVRVGCGFLSGGDVHAYVSRPEVLQALSAGGLIEDESYPDRVLARPWPGPPRLLAVAVDPLPDAEEVAGLRVVTEARLESELMGAVGVRPDLFARLIPPD